MPFTPRSVPVSLARPRDRGTEPASAAVPRRRGPLKRLTQRVLRGRVLASLLSAYLNLCRRTARWELRDAHHLRELSRAPEGYVLAFWHECLPLMPLAWSALWDSLGPDVPRKPGLVLVSRSRDGRMIGALLERFGLATVDGSSSAGGTGAARDLLGGLRAGGVAVVVPDGPRGPRRGVTAGGMRLAAMAGVPMVPCGAHAFSSFRLGSWDRMVIPLPFSRCVAVVGRPIPVPPGGAGEAAEALRLALDAALERAGASAGGTGTAPNRPA